MRVGPQRRGQNPCISPVVLRDRRREAIPEAVELLRIDGVDHQTPLHQALDHRSARRLDRHADFPGLSSRERQQPVCQLRQPCTAMLERPLSEHVAVGVEHAYLMLLRAPIDTREPLQLQVQPPVRRIERACQRCLPVPVLALYVSTVARKGVILDGRSTTTCRGCRGRHRRQEPAWTSVRGAGVKAVSPAKRGRSAATRLDAGEHTRTLLV